MALAGVANIALAPIPRATFGAAPNRAAAGAAGEANEPPLLPPNSELADATCFTTRGLAAADAGAAPKPPLAAAGAPPNIELALDILRGVRDDMMSGATSRARARQSFFFSFFV